LVHAPPLRAQVERSEPREAVLIDTGPESPVDLARSGRGSPTRRMTERANPREIKVACNGQPRRAGPIVATELVPDETDVIRPPLQPAVLVGDGLLLGTARRFPARVVKCYAASVREDRQHGIIGVGDGGHHVAVTGELFELRRVDAAHGTKAMREDEHRAPL